MSQVQSAIAATVATQPNIASAPKTYSLGQLSVQANAPMTAYDGALTLDLQDANQVTEYELTTFSRAMKGSQADFDRLQADADVYGQIAGKLAAIKVPTPIAADHLSALNSLSALSSATKDLAQWNGDPLAALTLVNNFIKADDTFSDDLTTLVAHMHSWKNHEKAHPSTRVSHRLCLAGRRICRPRRSRVPQAAQRDQSP